MIEREMYATGERDRKIERIDGIGRWRERYWLVVVGWGVGWGAKLCVAPSMMDHVKNRKTA